MLSYSAYELFRHLTLKFLIDDVMIDVDVESNIQITSCELLNEQVPQLNISSNAPIPPAKPPASKRPPAPPTNLSTMKPFLIDNKSGRLVFPNQPEKLPFKVENKRICMVQSASCPSFSQITSFSYEQPPMFLQQSTESMQYSSMPEVRIPPMASGEGIVPHPFQISMPDMCRNPVNTVSNPLDRPIKKEPCSPIRDSPSLGEPKLIQVHSIKTLLRLVKQESAENEMLATRTLVASKPNILKPMLSQCRICYCFFLTESEVKGHVTNEHMTSDRRIFCSYCSYTTWNESELVTHLFSKHKQYPKVRYLKCGICSQKFIDEHILFQHMRHHTDYFASRNYFRNKIKIKRVENSC